jgi:MFS family permease
VKKGILVVFLTVVLDLVGFGIVIPLLTFYAEKFDATPTEVTLLMACFSLAQFFVAPLFGQLSDRVGRRPVLVGSIGMTALMLAGFASARSLWVLFLFRTLHGAMTANVATAQACMADLTTPENRAKGMGLIGAGFGIGFTIGPWMGGELARYSLETPIWVAAGLSALNFLFALAMLPETRHAGSDRSRRTISPMALVHALGDSVVGLCILLNFVQIFAFALMESTFTLFAEHAHGMRAMDVGRMFGLVGVIGIVVQGGLIGRLVKRHGERPMVTTGLVLLCGGLAVMPFAARGLPLSLDFAVVAVGQALANPSLQALISRGAGAGEQGSVLGSSQSMGALARATGPALGGMLFSRVSIQAPFLFSALLLALGAALSIPATARASARPT